MAEFALTPDVITNPTTGSWALGNTKIQYVIPRQNRRLEKAVLHINGTTGATMTSAGATDKLEGLVAEARTIVSDKAGSGRRVHQCPGSTLLHWHRRFSGKTSRFNQTVIGQTATSSTFNYFLPMHFRHPLSTGVTGLRQTIPGWSKDQNGDGLSSDMIFEFDVSAAGSRTFGFSTATCTFNYVRLILYWREIGQEANISYVPSVWETEVATPSSGGTGVKIPFAKDGYLTSTLFETFTTWSTGVRGNVLATAASDFYDLFYGRSPIGRIYPEASINENENWSDSYPTDVATLRERQDGFVNTANVFYSASTIFAHDFWHDTAHGDANSLNSCPNLYTENRGDLVELRPTTLISSSTNGLQMTHHKFLTQNPAALNFAG